MHAASTRTHESKGDPGFVAVGTVTGNDWLHTLCEKAIEVNVRLISGKQPKGK